MFLVVFGLFLVWCCLVFVSFHFVFVLFRQRVLFFCCYIFTMDSVSLCFLSPFWSPPFLAIQCPDFFYGGLDVFGPVFFFSFQ